MIQLVRYPARRLHHEFTPRLARPTNRPRLRISIRGAARELHDRSRPVLQWAGPRDAALLGDQSTGRAVQGGAYAWQVNLLRPQWECCPTVAADRCRPFRRYGPHRSGRRCDWTATGCACCGGAIRASPVGRSCWSPAMRRPVEHGQHGKVSNLTSSTAIFRRSPMRAGGYGRACSAV